MKKTTQIHIGGRHFFIDDDAYEKLNHYLNSLKAHFSKDGETGKEIVEDIEQRIAELLEKEITNGKQSVTSEDVNKTIKTLGNVEDFKYEITDDSGDERDFNYGKDHRKLFRDPDNYYIGGVCSGIGEYFDIDPLWVRLAFVALIFAKGLGALIYVILWIVVPKARNTAEKLQMRGRPVNINTIKQSVNEDFEKIKYGVNRPYSSENTRDAFGNFIRAMGLIFVAIFKFFIGFLGVIFLIVGSIFLAIFIIMMLGFTNVLNHFPFGDHVLIPDISSYFVNSGYYYAVVIAIAILVLIPIAGLIYGGIKILFNVKTRHPVLRAFLLTAWILSLILFITLIFVNVPNNAIEASGSETYNIDNNKKYKQLVIDINENTGPKRMTHFHVFGHNFNYSDWNDALYDKVTLYVEKSADDKMYLEVHKKTKNVHFESARRYFNKVDYSFNQEDSVVYLNQYFFTDDDDFWLFPEVELTLQIPVNQEIIITPETCEILHKKMREEFCNEYGLAGEKCIMTEAGNLQAVK